MLMTCERGAITTDSRVLRNCLLSFKYTRKQFRSIVCLIDALRDVHSLGAHLVPMACITKQDMYGSRHLTNSNGSLSPGQTHFQSKHRQSLGWLALSWQMMHSDCKLNLTVWYLSWDANRCWLPSVSGSMDFVRPGTIL